MEKSLTREEMRELDRKAIEEYKIPGIVLMENAGRNLAEEILQMIDDPHQAKVAILCGKGNNGGDGFVVARHLHNHSIHVDVFLIANKIRVLVEQSGFPVGADIIRVTASVCATIVRSNDTVATLFERIDKLMEHSKVFRKKDVLLKMAV